MQLKAIERNPRCFRGRPEEGIDANTKTRSHSSQSNDDGVDRRGFLKCMAWAGTGALLVMKGGS